MPEPVALSSRRRRSRARRCRCAGDADAAGARAAAPAASVPRTPHRGRFRYERRPTLGRVLHDHHPPGGGALDLPARQGRRGDRARQQHPRHRLQRLAGRPAALPRRRLPDLPLADARAARPRRTASAPSTPRSTPSPRRPRTAPASATRRIYITHTPCIHCFKVLINTGITRICYEQRVQAPHARAAAAVHSARAAAPRGPVRASGSHPGLSARDSQSPSVRSERP